jgi:hypothetical protein
MKHAEGRFALVPSFAEKRTLFVFNHRPELRPLFKFGSAFGVPVSWDGTRRYCHVLKQNGRVVDVNRLEYVAGFVDWLMPQ